MNCYVILREYYNNVSVIDAVYSSKKKAQAHINEIISYCDRDGWGVTHNYRYMNGMNIPCIEITSPNGVHENTERYYIIKKEIK